MNISEHMSSFLLKIHFYFKEATFDKTKVFKKQAISQVLSTR